MPDDALTPALPPERLRRLVSWQTNKVATLGTRLTARRMATGARSDFAVLAALEELGNLSQADLGRHLGLDRNDVNGIVNRLEGAGFAARRADPQDRRRNIITLEPAGRAHLDELQVHADDVQEGLLVALSSDEREVLIELLGKVLAGHGPQPA
ncbi:MAG: MarR family winged helix-turn-helix transcriptional regulator [Janthinobacterium lividum]